MHVPRGKHDKPEAESLPTSSIEYWFYVVVVIKYVPLVLEQRLA
jgi:hypothetical protein